MFWASQISLQASQYFFICCYFEVCVLLLKRIVLDFQIRLSVHSNPLKISLQFGNVVVFQKEKLPQISRGCIYGFVERKEREYFEGKAEDP
jgi:hypothetical protein